MKISNPQLSIIIPIFNETKRIRNINEVITYFRTQTFPFEIIIVDDGSTDKTLSMIKKMNLNKMIKLISYKSNKGKGFAIKTGMLNAKGKYRLFFDIDLSTPLKEFEKFIPFLDSHQLIIASRKRTGAILLKRQSEIRENLGKGFTWLSQQILDVKVSDLTCGFKCFSEDAANIIFKNLTINRWGFDSEILFLATKYKFSIKEIPVTWINDENTKVKFPQDLIRSFYELAKIRINDIRGIYR